jgi:hypothetical protein
MNQKAQLLARLATERAWLWWELVGLSAETLVGQPVLSDWTPKDLLAHVAFWDDASSERLRLALAGRAAEIPYLDMEAVNVQVYAERRDWPLAQTVAECQRARADFLALLDPLTWEAITQPYTLSWGDPRSIADWAQRRAWHDADHQKQPHNWRESAGSKNVPGPQCVLLAALAAGRAELLAWAGLIPEAERATRRVCGQWALQDVLGHVTDWEVFVLEGLRQMAAGEVAGTGYGGDEEAWNWSHVKARRGQPWETTWGDFVGARQKLLAALEGLDDAALARPVPSRWSAEDSAYMWARVCLAHDREHAEGLSKALAR